MADAYDNPNAAGAGDELDFRPLSSPTPAPRPRPAATQARPDSGMYGDGIDFQPHAPGLTFDTLHRPATPQPIGAAAGTASLTRSLEPPKYPVPPKPTGLETLSGRSKPGDEVGSNGTRYRFDGLNWTPVGSVAPQERAPEVTGALTPKPLSLRLTESMTEPGTFLGDAGRETGAVPGTGPGGHTTALDLRGRLRAPRSLTEALALGAGETPRQAQAAGEAGQKPLLDVLAATGAENPVSRGFARFATGLTTPENLELAGLAGGFEALPVAVSKIASGVFGYQMAKGLYEMSGPFKQAVDRGDWNTAVEIGSQMVPQAAMTFLAGAHALSGSLTATRAGVGELSRRTGDAGGLLEEMGQEPRAGTTLDRTKAAWEPVARGQTVEDLNAQRARDLQANAAGARGMANLEGRTALRVPPAPRLALPPIRPTPVETIGGEPVQVRIFPSDEPLITPEPIRTPEGAILTRPSLLSTRKLLPPAVRSLPPEETEFLAGKPGPVPPLRSAAPLGPVESYAEGYRPRLSTSLAVPTTPPTPDIDFKPLTEQPAATRPSGKTSLPLAVRAPKLGAVEAIKPTGRPTEMVPPAASSGFKPKVTPRSESLKTYNSLPQEIREYVDSQVKEIPRMPQILREGRMEELKQYGGKGTMLKERLAREALQYAGETPSGSTAEAQPVSGDKGNVNETLAEIKRLQARERELSEKSTRVRDWRRGLRMIEQAQEANAKWQELKASLPGAPPGRAEGVIPGLEEAVTEQKRATGQYQAGQLTEEINRPAESVETAAGEMESKSPLFRGTEASPQREIFGPGKERGTLSAGIDPTRAAAAVRVLGRAWQEKIAQPFIDKVLKIGDKYQKARAADPAVAQGLHLLDNAPQYLRQKAAQQVHEVIGNLSRAQERLFVLMADADSRENLRANHPAEYREALSDRAVQEALRKYQPLERELTATRQRLGGDTLEGDYLKRVYDKYVAGIGKEQAPGSAERGTSAYDRVIRPQRIGNMSREAAAEYHYQNGLHEFGPAFATKFIGTNLRALRDTVAKEFLSKAKQLEPGAPEPRSIEYSGETYYRPDIAADMPKGTKVYDRYDPTAGEKFPQAADGKFLGPREVVNALNDFGRREDAEPGALRRFFQEQVIGFGFGVPHVANILRRVTQSVPGGALNPKGWADAWRVALSKELRERGIQGINDPTFDKLLRQGAITTGEMANLKDYWGGNFNPANWARAMAQVGHKILFEPGSAGGFGGIDQRARLHIADLIRSQRPELSDEQIASGVRDALGDYNRANWSDRQKMLAKFMMFPGWDASSVRWVIQHPIRTTVPPAVLVYLANQTLHHFGQNRAEDATDIDTIHLGDRAYGTGLLRESVSRNLFRPFINYAQAKLQGANEQHAQSAAARGLTSGAGGLLGMLRPDLSGFIALAANRQALFSGKELLSRDDFSAPGKILPSRALEKTAVFAIRKAIPSLDRMLDSDQELDLKSFAGGNLGLPNYRDDAERRLVRNAAQAEEAYQEVSKLAKTDPAQAREYMRDPDNAAYALFHRDFSQVVSALKRIDDTREHIEASGLTAADKKNRLAALDKSRQTLLGHADTLNNVLFERRQAQRKAFFPTAPRPLLNQPRTRAPLGVQ